MSEKEQGVIIGNMAEMPEADRQFLLGVMVGMTAKQKPQTEQQQTEQKAEVRE